MAYTLKESVPQEIKRVFAPEHIDHVRSRRSECELLMERSAPPPRVHITVLWLSKGDFKRSNHELENACCDWRGMLVVAGLAIEDWKFIFTKNDIDCGDW